MTSIRNILERKREAVAAAGLVDEKTNKLKTPKAEIEKIVKFVNNLPYLLANKLPAVIDFFKARPIDIVYIGYDKELKLYATSIDSNTWTKLTKSEIKFSGYMPVPERGTIWQAKNSKALYIVLEFVNCNGILLEDEHPSILYMNELGHTRICKIVDWPSKFIFCDHTVGKGN